MDHGIAYIIEKYESSRTRINKQEEAFFSEFEGLGNVVEFDEGADEYISSFLEITIESVALDCPGDANGDGEVNIVDALAVSSNFGCIGFTCEGDANHDGIVNIVDLLTISANWGFTCP